MDYDRSIYRVYQVAMEYMLENDDSDFPLVPPPVPFPAAPFRPSGGLFLSRIRAAMDPHPNLPPIENPLSFFLGYSKFLRALDAASRLEARLRAPSRPPLSRRLEDEDLEGSAVELTSFSPASSSGGAARPEPLDAPVLQPLEPPLAAPLASVRLGRRGCCSTISSLLSVAGLLMLLTVLTLHKTYVSGQWAVYSASTRLGSPDDPYVLSLPTSSMNPIAFVIAASDATRPNATASAPSHSDPAFYLESYAHLMGGFISPEDTILLVNLVDLSGEPSVTTRSGTYYRTALSLDAYSLPDVYVDYYAQRFEQSHSSDLLPPPPRPPPKNVTTVPAVWDLLSKHFTHAYCRNPALLDMPVNFLFEKKVTLLNLTISTNLLAVKPTWRGYYHPPSERVPQSYRRINVPLPLPRSSKSSSVTYSNATYTHSSFFPSMSSVAGVLSAVLYGHDNALAASLAYGVRSSRPFRRDKWVVDNTFGKEEKGGEEKEGGDDTQADGKVYTDVFEKWLYKSFLPPLTSAVIVNLRIGMSLSIPAGDDLPSPPPSPVTSEYFFGTYLSNKTTSFMDVFFGMFLLFGSTALIVRTITSSGVVVMYPMFSFLRWMSSIFGFSAPPLAPPSTAGAGNPLARERMLHLSYPWIGGTMLRWEGAEANARDERMPFYRASRWAGMPQPDGLVQRAGAGIRGGGAAAAEPVADEGGDDAGARRPVAVAYEAATTNRLTIIFEWVSRKVRGVGSGDWAVMRGSNAILTSHMLKLIMYYAMYEAVQAQFGDSLTASESKSSSLEAGRFDGGSLATPSDVPSKVSSTTLFALAMVCEYYTLIFARSSLSVKFSVRMIFLYFMGTVLYIKSSPFAYGGVAIAALTFLLGHLFIFTVCAFECRAYRIGLVSLESPREVWAGLPWGDWGSNLGDTFSIFLPINRRSYLVQDRHLEGN